MSPEQRLEIQSLLLQVFDGFTDERLKGTYYSIADMSEEEQQKLIDAHYMFTTDDFCLKTVGTYDDWPAVNLFLLSKFSIRLVFSVN